MKRRIFILSFLLLLSLSACGNGEADSLREENAALQAQIAALEEENGRLSLKNDLLGQDLAAAQDALEQLGTQQEENPIDPFYAAADMNNDGSTFAMSAVAWGRASAWEAEARNLAAQLKARLPLQEDRDLVDACLAAVEEQVRRMNIMSIYPAADVGVSQTERTGTVGTLAHILCPAGQAQIWKDTFYQLRQVLPGDQSYEFIFDPEAAQQMLP